MKTLLILILPFEAYAYFLQALNMFKMIVKLLPGRNWVFAFKVISLLLFSFTSEGLKILEVQLSQGHISLHTVNAAAQQNEYYLQVELNAWYNNM